jgi:hypothetical protein
VYEGFTGSEMNFLCTLRDGDQVFAVELAEDIGALQEEDAFSDW